MPSPTTRAPARPALRQARIAVGLLFLTNGAVPANLIPRLPALKSELSLSNTEFGLAIAAGPIGALAAGLLAGMLIRRFRSARVAVSCMVLFGLVIVLAGSAQSWAFLAAALFLGGALDSVVDVAQNSHGLRVQRLYGRSILNSFHAMWSVGAVTGGLMGAAAVGLGVSLTAHLTASAVIFAAVNLTGYRFLLPGPEPVDTALVDTALVDTALVDTAAHPGSTATSPGVRPGVRLGTLAVLLALGVIALSGSIVEDAGNTWATLYLAETLHAAAGVAAFGFIALAGTQFLGRLTGDRLVDRFGQRAVARTGGAVAALGMGLALAVPTIPGTILGFGAAGFGIATLVPAAMESADGLPGFRTGTGLTILSWMMRIGFLLSPPLVGLIADATTLRIGLLIVPLAGLLVVALAGALPARRVATSARAGAGSAAPVESLPSGPEKIPAGPHVS
ncbi:MFS transporter [Pengzhenrongella frigida]|uniref:MFS transporter n=1 Tax=Pengzhenrongella frigida TaxID=1259133 RepID=A0A4Q5N3D1_9MICO|nr:MFS transporter [Cellulomonas sp. HLT2-17]RYV52732.1 MFS transporter [Cellulomonas sp. HLT2-17]